MLLSLSHLSWQAGGGGPKSLTEFAAQLVVIATGFCLGVRSTALLNEQD